MINIKKVLMVMLASIALTACATRGKKAAMITSDIYIQETTQ